MSCPDIQTLLHHSLRHRQIDLRLHYKTSVQAEKWKQVHQTHSPAARSSQTQRIYEQAFQHIAHEWPSSQMLVVSIGCGNGTKDIKLFQILHGLHIHYMPCDMSSSLVMDCLTASQKFANVRKVTPIIANFSEAGPLRELLDSISAAPRFFLFLGILPGMAPGEAAACLRTLVRTQDSLIVSANLLPPSGWQQIMPQYDNAETRDWLLTLFDEIGIPRESGTLRFQAGATSDNPSVPRIEAYFEFTRFVRIEIDEEEYCFDRGDKLLLFYSHRFTPDRVHPLFHELGLPKPQTWLDSSSEEGVFLSIPAA